MNKLTVVFAVRGRWIIAFHARAWIIFTLTTVTVALTIDITIVVEAGAIIAPTDAVIYPQLTLFYTIARRLDVAYYCRAVIIIC
ncbi:MAG: hypothetical protein GY854_07540 [Deltaproteobacteria bacterium]|nr:hypothetical protein [Deltaproteobacteria bacterium]